MTCTIATIDPLRRPAHDKKVCALNAEYETNQSLNGYVVVHDLHCKQYINIIGLRFVLPVAFCTLQVHLRVLTYSRKKGSSIYSIVTLADGPVTLKACID